MLEIMTVFVSALAILFIARKIARWVGLVDKPNGRKHHEGHIPLVGGVSVYLCLWVLFVMQSSWLPNFTLYMVCATLLLIVGVLDDRFDLPVLPRIGLQAGIAILMIWHGLYLKTFGNVLFGYELTLGVIGTVITLFAVWGAINAFNMVDGVDGLLGVLFSVTFSSLAIVFGKGGHIDIALWCLCLVVSSLPYLLLNLGVIWGRKFKVFMGDSGSTLIGFTVIWLLILATQGENAVIHPVIALWLIAVPLMDMVRVMISRIRRGSSPFKPDREHLHHILMRSGLSARKTVVVMASLAVLFSTIGIVGDIIKVPDTMMLIFFVAMFYVYFRFVSQLSLARVDNVYSKL